MVSPESATDEEIARAVQQGDKEAFGHLIDRYQVRLERYARRFLRRKEDQDDQIQEVFIKAFTNIQSFDTDKRFSPWLYRIAHNTFINELRRHSYNPLYFFETDTIFPQFSAKETADAETVRRELGVAIEEALEHLSDKYRAVLILFFYEELSYQEIAEVLRIPISTVGVRIRRGKEQLKKYLNHHTP